MTEPLPTVGQYMTEVPVSIDKCEHVGKARAVMVANKIRHLPVMDCGDVIGIITDRDLKMIFGCKSLDPAELKVGDVCNKRVYEVDPNASLIQVASVMAEKKYGCTIIVKNSKLVGIFTTVDVCRALALILEKHC